MMGVRRDTMAVLDRRIPLCVWVLHSIGKAIRKEKEVKI